MKPFGCHSWNLNGPVPTGVFCRASLFASMELGTMAMVASELRSAAEGSLSFISTVVASTALALSTAERRLASGEAMSLLSTRLIVDTTSSASIAEPSWNLTPERSLKV